MAVRVLFLGPLQDCEGAPEREFEAPLDWNGLLLAVSAETSAQLKTDRVHVAAGGKVLADKTALLAQEGDEVALLPPVSGG